MEESFFNTEIEKLTIVGAGTAGAMAAAYLREHLPSNIKISVIVPDKNERIGVGEATVPSIRFFMRSLGLKEVDWLPKVSGTYKVGIKFTNWTEANDSYFHPFHREKDFQLKGIDYEYGHKFLDILDFNLRGESHSTFLKNTSLASFISENFLSPVSISNKSHLSFAYHFDATLFSDFLLNYAQARGVEIIKDEVKAATFHENGFIKSLQLNSGNSHLSDFYVDCSGFCAQLIQKSLGVPFVSYSDRLFTDHALALNLANDFKKKLPPYTESVATDSGWIWKIPLRSRWGSGIVYNSNFESRDSAFEKLIAELDVDERQVNNVNEIKMSVGRRREVWKNNCVSLGLSSSFIEPLESTSIGLTEYQIFLIRKLLPKSKFDSEQGATFNRHFNSSFDKVVDFIALHYLGGDRNDSPFWSYIQDRKKSSDGQQIIQESIEFVKSGYTTNSYQMFDRYSYACVLSGLGRSVSINQSSLTSPEIADRALEKRKELEAMRERLKKEPYLHADHCKT